MPQPANPSLPFRPEVNWLNNLHMFAYSTQSFGWLLCDKLKSYLRIIVEEVLSGSPSGWQPFIALAVATRFALRKSTRNSIPRNLGSDGLVRAEHRSNII